VKLKKSAYRNDRLKLSLLDLCKLLIGRELRIPGLVVGLWRWPRP